MKFRMCTSNISGNYFKKIPDETQRKFLFTGVGLFMAFVVSGWHILHSLVSAALGIAAVVYVPPSKCNVAAFIIMFGYLMFFRLVGRFGFPEPPGPTNMIQMILTLKVAGVGFEKTDSWKKLQQREKEQTDKKPEDGQLVEITDYDVEIQSVGPLELFHYSFNYIGILTGPYYRYRTYRDYFDTPFKDYAPNVKVTVEKLKSAGIYCLLYLVVNHLYPLSYALSDEFYNRRSFFYRLMYVWPTFFIFRMRMYTGMTLSECVCTMAGFGAYPDEAEAVIGRGPKKQYQHLKRDAEKRTYNFTTIVNVRVMDVEKCCTFRETLKHWNICVQYWLAVNVYKLFPLKQYRTIVTFVVSAYWHGFRPGHYFCIMGAPFYLIPEDMWNVLLRIETTGFKRRIIDVIFWIAKFFAFSYLGTGFLLVSFDNIWKFYISIYHAGFIAALVMTFAGFNAMELKEALDKRWKRKEEQQVAGGSSDVHKPKAE